MKFKVNSSDISKGLKSCFYASDPKDATYASISFEAEGETVRIKASNVAYSISFSCIAQVEEDGNAVVDGKTSYNAISKASGTYSFSTDERSLIFKANGRTRIPELRREILEIQEARGKENTCDSVEFKNAINKIRYAISEDQSRIILTGAHLVTDGSVATVTALDGFRLAQTEFICTGETIDVVIPEKVLSAVCDSITSGPMKIVSNGSRISFSYANYIINALPLSGAYIDTGRLLPTEFATNALVRTTAVRDMVDAASVASGAQNMIKLRIGEDKIAFMSRSETADFFGDVDAVINGNPVDISFNLKYLANAISHIDTEHCEVKLNNSLAPVIFSPHGENTAPEINLVLPVRTFGDQ